MAANQSVTVKVSASRFYRFWMSGVYAFAAVSAVAEKVSRFCCKRALNLEVAISAPAMTPERRAQFFKEWEAAERRAHCEAGR